MESKKLKKLLIKKRSIPKKTIEKRDLLLAYTYFLKSKHNKKYFMTGIDSVDFVPEIILCDYDTPSSLTFNLTEWACLTSALNKTMNNEKELKCFLPLLNNIELRIFGKNNNKKVTIKRLGTPDFIVLEHSEWKNVCEMNSLIMTMMHYFKNAVEQIKEYMDQYVEKCVELNTFNLDKTTAFLPLKTHFCFNFTRLFYELPVFCKDIIAAKVMNKMLIID